MNTITNWLLSFLILAPAVLIAVTFHEYAHGAVANMLGDPTAKEQGRLSLNPLRHLDPIGTLLFVIFRFGWGKPVPVDSRHFKRPRWDMVLVSLAGPATNFSLAALFGLLIKFQVVTISGQGGGIGDLLGILVLMTAQINIVLGVFNLLPLPPLDGSRLVSALLPAPMLKHYHAIEGYGIAIIFISVYFFPGRLFGLFEPFIKFFQHLFLA
ncbi:MAG: site-2 protease family protein [Actinomycetota bacterium]|nr:site-2 protease family protein [Actinomycetota bacterium]